MGNKTVWIIEKKFIQTKRKMIRIYTAMKDLALAQGVHPTMITEGSKTKHHLFQLTVPAKKVAKATLFYSRILKKKKKKL